MESVYKLSKYSQKISEACRAKQLDKVMEYNQHELAHINKLSKYFGNQKGGATVDQVVGAVGDLVKDVVADRNEVIRELQQSVEKNSKVIAQIDNEVEGEGAFSLSEIAGKAQPAPQPTDVLRKVKNLKEESDRLTRENETLQREKGADKGTISRDAGTLERIRASLTLKEQELDEANAQLAQARVEIEKLEKAQALQAQNYKDAATVSAESVKRIQTEHKQALAQAQAQLADQANAFKLQLDVVQGKVDQKNKDHLAVLEAKDARIAELEQAVADTQQMMTQGEEKLQTSLHQLQSQKP